MSHCTSNIDRSECLAVVAMQVAARTLEAVFEGFIAFLVVKGIPRTCHLLRLQNNAKPETDVNLLVLRPNGGETGRPNAVSPWSTGADVGGAEHDRGAGVRGLQGLFGWRCKPRRQADSDTHES